MRATVSHAGSRAAGLAVATQMAATWWVPMGPFDGSGQDMNTHTHRWRPTESGQEMDMLTIDLLRSMIHNLVIGQWGTCSHRAGTVTLAQRANIAERTSPPDLWKFQQHSFCVPALCCWLKTSQNIFKRSAIHCFSHQCYCLCICRSLLYL